MKFYLKQPIEAEQFDGSKESAQKLNLFRYRGAWYLETADGSPLVTKNDWILKSDFKWPELVDGESFEKQYATLPVIPKAVADWIEKCKHDGTSVGDMLCSERRPEKMRDWMALTPGTYEFNQKKYTECQNFVARAWLDGYVVEEKHD
ncbi:DUF1642 domain-containing protein [Lactiplantibacillus mudanjiangensis]|uniref:DUF1642 domain-containing protein n=1 Tax=Lactiplantibacillus mudanjiangensis TaxID=1296538 RepID=A0A660E713_9LACO|nr:DUF1642 domain-containing protein [Lactiplantibacillus mudanjiangensis]VDG25826.1 hypothetical protein [Lactobacillus plantarum subsp. plantarum] [Lactiplantibacillus mudanjiangensis]VDG28893.1 hypothetical protein [Lactobacillus plantarum subsp. plantarum] [Lactiplantibacillus mudanjiangensis]